MFILDSSSSYYCRLYEMVPEQKYETSASSLDDIMMILKSDYDNAYFVTGTFFRLFTPVHTINIYMRNQIVID